MIPLKRYAVFAALAAGMLLSAATLPPEVEFRRDGSFRIDTVTLQLQHFSDTWKAVDNAHWILDSVQNDKNSVTIEATTQLSGTPARVRERIWPTAPGRFKLEYTLTPEKPAVANAVHALIAVPPGICRIQIDGAEFDQPEKSGKLHLFQQDAIDELRLSLPSGYDLVVTGDQPMSLLIQDDRRFQNDQFALRLAATPAKGEITTAKLLLNFSLEPVRCAPVDIAAAANRGFADAPPETRGWTNQGADNDLRSLPSGMISAGNLRFDILAPTANHGRAAIVVAGGDRKFEQSSRRLELPATTTARAVNLLHASAWTPPHGKPIGELSIEYADGQGEVIPVIAGRDCGNWWDPYDMPNAYTAWRGKNPLATVGLYASVFPLHRGDPRRITFTAASGSVWMIAAVSLADRPAVVPTGNTRIRETSAGDEWLELAYQRRPHWGGALDFSAMNDAPAGKYGFVRPAPDGTLTFENAPGKRIRFFGANLVHAANFLSKETAEEVAAYFSYMGYNSVRFHHYDQRLLDSRATDSLTFDPQQLDRLDYLFAKMKERGIYVTIDLYSLRTLKKGDNIPECTWFDDFQLKPLLPLSSGAMKNWQEFTRKLLTHRNPYTGLTWAEDPALFCINMVNEDTLSANWKSHPAGVALYRAAFERYRQEHNLPASGLDYDNNPELRRFLHELEKQTAEAEFRFIREELNVKTMLTSLNWQTQTPLTLTRNGFDLVDNHSYFDHPRFPVRAWQLPMQFHQRSAIRDLAATPRAIMATRIPGKPFLMTEFNYCNPNRFRAESGPLIGAYAALQNWDGLYRFAWASNSAGLDKLGHAYSWDAMADPFAQLSERITCLLFRRGDVTAAPTIFSQPVPADPFAVTGAENFSVDFQHLGLVTGIGSHPANSVLPPGSVAREPGHKEINDVKTAALHEKIKLQQIAESVTGELRLDAKHGTFSVNTPLSACVTLPAGMLSAGTLEVSDASTFQTVAALSLDGKPLAGSRSILLVQLTELSNTGRKTNENGTLLYDWGTLPLLLRRGRAEIALETAEPFRVMAFDADGNIRGEVASTHRDGKLRFTADTGIFPGGVMAYHLMCSSK